MQVWVGDIAETDRMPVEGEDFPIITVEDAV
jgi:hypothetical protein